MELTKEHFEQYLNQVLDIRFKEQNEREEKRLDYRFDQFYKKIKIDIREAVDDLARCVTETIAIPMEEQFQQVDVRFQEIRIEIKNIHHRLERLEAGGSLGSRVVKLENDMGSIKKALYITDK